MLFNEVYQEVKVRHGDIYEFIYVVGTERTKI